MKCVILVQSGFLFRNSGAIKFLGEECMFEVTQKAAEMIKETTKDQEEISAIRVVYNEGG